MPNWCSNTITINNLSREQVKDMLRYIEENEGSFFQYFRPRPKKDDEDWYHWNLGNWGTKWDACYTHVVEFGTDFVSINFESAWAPPTILYYYMHDDGYEFEAEYEEPMMGFAGIFEDGVDMYWETLELNEEENV